MQGQIFVKIDENAKLPEINNDGIISLFALESINISPNDRVLVKTGLKAIIPEKHCLILCNDFTLSFMRGVLNAKYVITSTNEINIILFNIGKSRSIFKKHDKICEAVILPMGNFFYQ